jgi:hypothetical protein
MPKLVKHTHLEGQDFLRALAKQDVLVYEDVQGSKIWVNWDGFAWSIRPRNIGDAPINMVDLAMQKFYNRAFLYFATLDAEVVPLLNRDWYFCFEYFADESPANITYARVPKNNLILTCICKGRRNYCYDPDELAEYARLFDVDLLPVIYRGRLSAKQLELLNYFLHTSPQDLEHIFAEENFASFFYKILNPAVGSSFLMAHGEFQDNLERIIIRLLDQQSEVALQVLNPMYARVSGQADTDFVEVYSLLLLNFVLFCQTVDVAALPIKGKTRDELYLDLVCRLFNMYMLQASADIIAFDFSVPAFFDQDKFRINRDFIQNKATREWLLKSAKLEYVLKIVLSALQRHKKKPGGVFTERAVTTLNMLVDACQAQVARALQQNQELQRFADRLLSFGEFAELRWDADADGKVYPSMDDELDVLDGGKKKKKLLPGKKAL